MSSSMCRLEAYWNSAAGSEGEFELELFNLGNETLSGFKLAYTSLSRVLDPSKCKNATLLMRNANFHEYVPPAGFELKAGESWAFSVSGLNNIPSHRTDGASTAYITLADGTAVDIDHGDLMLRGQEPTHPGALVPEGKTEVPAAMLPWPKSSNLSDFGRAPVALFPASGSETGAVNAMADIGALSQRLFPGEMAPFTLGAVANGLPVIFSSAPDAGEEGYGLAFSETGIELSSNDAAGRTYGLITLAQLLHGARQAPERFQFPFAGTIADAPRHVWRGCHLDVSRQFYPLESVERFIDILAWNKMNILHWHLADDEGWRLEINAYPELTDIGAKRGPKEKMTAQLGSGAKTSSGHYTQDEVRALIASAKKLNIEIMPEFDIPGHCTAVLHALPHLIDAGETLESYRSIQGYPNNALNPAMPETYAFLEKVFAEVAELFPFSYVHIGGDEVADGSWLASPKAQVLMKEHGLTGTMELQAHMLGKVKGILTYLGKQMSGWDEVAHGGGVDPEGMLLMAWQKAEIAVDLAKSGYDVVITPGQSYYLDMVQADDWLEPGTSWAGTVPPEHTYTYEAMQDFPVELAGKVKGIQGCIWSENLTSRQRFNHMVFPRLGAIAEAAWTPADNKSWQRFAAICKLMPEL